MISLAIPTYNSSEFIVKSFEQVFDDDRISEIIVSDDASDDFSQLHEYLSEFNSPKIKIYRNEHNLKAFRNKNKAVERCSHEWVILLDSDNIICPTYIDAWMNEKPWNPKILYLPDFA